MSVDLKEVELKLQHKESDDSRRRNRSTKINSESVKLKSVRAFDSKKGA